MTHVKALERAKVALMTKPDTTFFCELAFSLKYVWDEDIPTACVNGETMRLNPDFFMKWDREQQLGLILHETLHVAYMHMIRRGSRDKRIYNMAADYVINNVILDRGFKLPDGGLFDTKYRNMTTEQVYDVLIQKAQANDSNDFLCIGEDLEDGSASGINEEELSDKIQQTLVRAAIRSKEEEDKPGTIPGDIQLFLDKLLKPKLPWNRILQKYISQYTKNEYTFRKPNKRFFPAQYLPSLYSVTLIDLSIAVDISGSVSNSDFTRFVSEIASIFRMVKPKKINLIQFDTTIKSIDEVCSFRDLMNVKFKGRGGTDINELINWTNKNKPQLLLVFTDGEFEFYDYKTKQNVLWVIHDNPKFSPNFGKTIHYDIN